MSRLIQVDGSTCRGSNAADQHPAFRNKISTATTPPCVRDTRTPELRAAFPTQYMGKRFQRSPASFTHTTMTCQRRAKSTVVGTILFHPANKTCQGKRDRSAEPAGKTQMRRRVNPLLNLTSGEGPRVPLGG